jgi:uncharacterized membrane protein
MMALFGRGGAGTPGAAAAGVLVAGDSEVDTTGASWAWTRYAGRTTTHMTPNTLFIEFVLLLWIFQREII